MIVYLIRHGLSIANEKGLVTGTPSDALSSEGIFQIQRLARWIKGINLSDGHFITSQWKRARQTGMILWPDAAWEIDPRLGETNAGEVSDWSQIKFQNKFPDFNAYPGNAYPGGESHIDLNRRVIGWLDEVLKKRYSQMVIVTHAGPISCILQHILGLGMTAFPAFLPANASLTALEFDKNTGKRAGHLLTFSCGPINNLIITNE